MPGPRAALRLSRLLTDPSIRTAWMAVLPPLLAVVLQWLLWRSIQPYVWFLFYPAVFASSWIGGKKAGLWATALSVAVVWWLFVPPTFTVAKPDAPVLPALVFVAMGIAFSLSHSRLRRSEQSLYDLFDQAGDGIFVADLDGRYTHVNAAGRRMLGYANGELIGMTIADLIPAADLPRLGQAKERLLAGDSDVAEWTLRRKDGSYLAVEITAKILRDGRWQAFVRDIGERQHAQAQLRLAATVFDNTNEAILVADHERRVVTVNPAFTAITGFEAHEVIGRNPGLLNSGRQDEVFYRAMWDSLNTTGRWQGELWNRRKSGELFPAWENISVVKDPSGAVTHYVSVLSDVTPMKAAEERLSHLAHHDPLTGLPNRLMFVGLLEESIERARRHGQTLALLFIDLDRFKMINDSMGHLAGDELLKEIARRLKTTLRAEDGVARLGGDEFTVIMHELARADDAAGLAKKVIAALARPLRLSGREVVVSASVGIALFPDDARTVDDLTRAADSAMYRAKERGRGTYDFYSSDITERVVEHLRIEAGLRHALEHDELRLHFQPQFDPTHLRLVGMEALVRWQDPRAGLTMPEGFIAVAEQSGLINDIGAWVVHRACAQLRAWLDAGLQPVRISVNVSGRHILHDHLVEAVEHALEVNGLDGLAAPIEIEITESVLQALAPSAVVLQRLRALGVRIAIDDFGTGFSSLSVLKHLPIDTLKIDRVFVRNIPDDVDSKAIVSAMISMAHTLGLHVVAEGVETDSQLAFLRDAGCDEVQGYLLGRPGPAETIVPLLQAREAAATR